MSAADWAKSKKHQSELVAKSAQAVRLSRKLDNDEYHIAVEWIGEASFDEDDIHQFILYPTGAQETLAFVVVFSPRPLPDALPNASATFAAAADYWRQFWSNGGAVDLSDSHDSRAFELERRIGRHPALDRPAPAFRPASSDRIIAPDS